MLIPSSLLALAMVVQAASPRATLEKFLWEPTKKIGTVKQIEAIARKDPTTSELTQIGNNQSPIPNGLLTLTYPGLVIKLLIATYEGGSGLRSFEITDMEWLNKIGIPLPRTKSEIVKFLGPGRASPGGLLYQQGSAIGPMTLRLTFDGDKLI